MSISSLFKQMAMKLPDKVAIEFEDKRATFSEVDLQANKVANALEKVGILKGDRVAQFMPNSIIKEEIRKMHKRT